MRLPHHPDHVTRACQYGLVPAPGKPCPRTFVGRRCQNGKPTGCICENWTLLDHAQRWTRDGRPLLIGEPYDVNAEHFAEFMAELEELGLTAVVTGRSPWTPGRTVAIEIRHQGSDWS